MKILGIETSCDETAAAVVTDKKEILSDIVLSQTEEHSPYGGVVPEIASRAHIAHIEDVIKKALSEADTSLREIDGIAVTAGPGLIGGVIVGLMTAKGIASATKKPLIAVNHLEGHALTARLTNDVSFPFLLLLVSGGHCQILVTEKVGKYKKLGGTLDDSLGEAFDKTAKMLGMGYPGGPAVEKCALKGDENKFDLPLPLVGRKGCDFSFSGLKTAIYRTVNNFKTSSCGLTTGSMDPAIKSQDDKEFINDMCASFQKTAGDIVADRMQNAINMFTKKYPQGKHVVIAGGVAANKYLRKRLEEVVNKNSLEAIAPPVKLCTDNAVMIAWAGIERMKEGLTDSLDFQPLARWPLEKITWQ